MSLEHTQMVYRKIVEELMKEVREDPLIQSHLDKSTMDMLQNTWHENLKKSGIFNNAYQQDMRMISDR